MILDRLASFIGIGKLSGIEELQERSRLLEKRLENTEAIINAVPDMIFFLDQEMTIRRVNPQTLTSLGYSEEELLGESFFKFAAMGQGDEDRLRQRNPRKLIPMTLKARGGKEVPVFTGSMEISGEHGERLTVCIASDVSESGVIGELNSKVRELNLSYQKMFAYKEMLEESYEELKSVNKKKDEFISVAAHELKTPLAAIHGFSELLKNEGVIGSPEQRNRYLDIMLKETERLVRLVNEILDLSRLDIGTIKLNIEPLDVTEVLKEVDEIVSQEARSKGIELRYDIAKDLPLLEADEERLIQILINLIDNAIKFTERGGVTVSVNVENDSMLFRVADTGMGIPSEHWSRIFTRFYQVDSSFSRKVGGTGLGLSIVKEFIELFQGKVWFESSPGKGTTFFFTVPLKHHEPLDKVV